MFVYQPKFSVIILQLKKGKGVNYVIKWILKGLYSYIISPQYIHFLHYIKLFGCEIGIKFNREHLVVEQNSYASKIANAYVFLKIKYMAKKSYIKKLLVWCD